MFLIRGFNHTNSCPCYTTRLHFCSKKLLIQLVPIYSLVIQRRPTYYVLMFCQNK